MHKFSDFFPTLLCKHSILNNGLTVNTYLFIFIYLNVATRIAPQMFTYVVASTVVMQRGIIKPLINFFFGRNSQFYLKDITHLANKIVFCPTDYIITKSSKDQIFLNAFFRLNSKINQFCSFPLFLNFTVKVGC